MEKSRVDYLLSRGEQTSFAAAKQQAQREILGVFAIEVDTLPASERLDISQDSEANAILLAISVILQGKLDVGDFSELLANLATDLRTDGLLNSAPMATQLINNAVLLPLTTIRTQLTERYAALGISADIPPFERYVQQFITNSGYLPDNQILYAATGEHGPNILDTTRTTYPQRFYSFQAELPENTTLQIKVSGDFWFFVPASTQGNWTYTTLDRDDNSRMFTASRTGIVDMNFRVDIPPHYEKPDDYDPTPDSTGYVPPPPPTRRPVLIEVYENGVDSVSWSRSFFPEGW